MSQECLINRKYVTYFNQIEEILKDFNCKLNSKLNKNTNFYKYLTNYMPSSPESSVDSDLDSDGEVDNASEIDATDPNEINTGENETSDSKSNEKKQINNILDYSMTTPLYQTDTCNFDFIQKCNYYKNSKMSYILNNDYKIFGKKITYSSKKDLTKTLDLVENDFFTLKIEHNFRTDFKVCI